MFFFNFFSFYAENMFYNIKSFIHLSPKSFAIAAFLSNGATKKNQSL